MALKAGQCQGRRPGGKMPTYEYRCTDCGSRTEAVQSFSEPALTDCPDCGQGRLRKLFGNVGVVFKGSGFYRNDSRDEARKKAEKAQKSEKPEKSKSPDPAGAKSPEAVPQKEKPAKPDKPATRAAGKPVAAAAS